MEPKRLLVVGLLVVAAVAVFWYRSNVYPDRTEGPKPRLAVVTGGSGPYWQAIANGARSAARDLDVDVEIKMSESDEDVGAQMKIMLNLDLEQLDGVAISPLDAEAQTRRIGDLGDQVFVVTVDSDAPHSTRMCYVGASNLDAGHECGELVKEALPDGGKVAVLLANLTKDNLVERKKGLEEVLVEAPLSESPDEEQFESDYTLVAFLVDDGDDERCEAQLRELVSAHDDLAGIVGLNARHGPILLRVLEDMGRLGQIKLITFDAAEETLAGIEAGNIYATVAQDPYQYGYEAVRLLSSYCRRDESRSLPPPGVYSTMTIKTNIVRQDDVAEFRRVWNERLTEVASTP